MDESEEYQTDAVKLQSSCIVLSKTRQTSTLACPPPTMIISQASIVSLCNVVHPKLHLGTLFLFRPYMEKLWRPQAISTADQRTAFLF